MRSESILQRSLRRASILTRRHPFRCPSWAPLSINILNAAIPKLSQQQRYTTAIPPTKACPKSPQKFSHYNALTDSERECPVTSLRALLADEGPLAKWGWASLRTCYSPDSGKMWPVYQKAIQDSVNAQLSRHKKYGRHFKPSVCEEVLSRMDWKFVSDRPALDGLGWDEGHDFALRRWFRKWADATEQKENPATVRPPDLPRGHGAEAQGGWGVGHVPRYMHFLHFDHDCVQRMMMIEAGGGGEGGGLEWVNLIRCDPDMDFRKWEPDPHDTYESGERPEDQDNIGRISATMAMIGPNFYLETYGHHEIWYIYDREPHDPVWWYHG